jgi:multiple sugar transport system ATP-binding protein
MADLALHHVSKSYLKGTQAVHDFNLEVKHGEFIVIVGPSGSGKSTVLRMIAGLEEITSGDLFVEGNRVNDKASKDRDIAMVFQNYALYAHMTVYHNMAFSLVLRREKADFIHEKVMEAARILELEPQLNKYPKQLSGGQRQRVALGRAIVRDPKVFLLDEPLSNLDAKLRGSMRLELALLHKRLGATMIYVTHDQIEALTLADRIVVMDKGRVQQIGTPIEIYEHPENVFVAGFIGMPPMNFYRMNVISCEEVEIFNKKFTVDVCRQNLLKNYLGKMVLLGVRPEHFIVCPNGLELKVDICEKLGTYSLVHGKIDGHKTIVKIKEWSELAKGDILHVLPDWDSANIFDIETKVAINR